MVTWKRQRHSLCACSTTAVLFFCYPSSAQDLRISNNVCDLQWDFWIFLQRARLGLLQVREAWLVLVLWRPELETLLTEMKYQYLRAWSQHALHWVVDANVNKTFRNLWIKLISISRLIDLAMELTRRFGRAATFSVQFSIWLSSPWHTACSLLSQSGISMWQYRKKDHADPEYAQIFPLQLADRPHRRSWRMTGAICLFVTDVYQYKCERKLISIHKVGHTPVASASWISFRPAVCSDTIAGGSILHYCGSALLYENTQIG